MGTLSGLATRVLHTLLLTLAPTCNPSETPTEWMKKRNASMKNRGLGLGLGLGSGLGLGLG